MSEKLDSSQENLYNSAQSFDSLIAYQKDAVVSKTLLNKKTGTVTLFSFDKGQALSEHTAPFDAMVYIVDGESIVSIDGKETRVKKGEMIILPSNIAHAVKAISQFKMLLTMIRS